MSRRSWCDAHIPVLGKRHPDTLGRPARDVWVEAWPPVAPQVEAAMHRGESTWNEQTHVVVERNGFAEDAWFTWSYSPIRDESGAVVGLFGIHIEDTPRVLAARARDSELLGWLTEQRRTYDAMLPLSCANIRSIRG
ncbi:MAG: PAS domain-containing protein [Vicinamibacterales bacterium]